MNFLNLILIRRKCATIWRKEEDVLTFQINKVEGVIFTRRGLLSKIAGMFDPLGLASPATIKGKIGLQKLSG